MTRACWRADAAKADYYEAAAKGHDPKLVANFTTNELTSNLAKNNIEIDRARSRRKTSAR